MMCTNTNKASAQHMFESDKVVGMIMAVTSHWTRQDKTSFIWRAPDFVIRVVLKGLRVRLLCADAGAELARAGRALVSR